MDWSLIASDVELDHHVHAAMTIATGLVFGLFVEVVVRRSLLWLTSRTKSELDDVLVGLFTRPIAITCVLVGLWSGLAEFEPEPATWYIIEGLLISTGALAWTRAWFVGSMAVLDTMSHPDSGFVQPRTRPLLDLVARIAVLAGGLYFLFIAWGVDVSAWLASAGILGVAMGFAAQQTLANLFAGVSILVDRPYKIGDYLVLEGGTRGRVTEIGMRSTRMITREDVEVIIPNSEMASARIINESGGPTERERVSAVVGVAYGSDIDHVRRVLIECAMSVNDVVKHEPEHLPRVRFREFGDSALIIHLLVWIPLPELRGKVVDELNTTIYKRFQGEGIIIPYPQRVVRMVRDPEPGE
jgi:MscS family membrane protein